MRVVREDLEKTQIQRLIVTDTGGSDHHPGECVGYLCPQCYQADETLDQVWHQESCSLAGEHGRAHYDDLEPDVPGRPTPEFDEDNEIIIVEAAETEGRGGLCEGEVLAFLCECGNADEDAFEIIHDERCELADRDQHLEETSAPAVPSASVSDSRS